MSDWIKILGSGLIVGIINVIYNHLNSRKTGRVEYLEEQINRLYGPLYFYCSTNQMMLSISNKISDNLSYEDENISSEEIENTIRTINKYANEINENNKSLSQTLKSNLSYCDISDWYVFQTILVDSFRSDVEKENGKISLPINVYKKVGDIFYTRSDINKHVESRYLEKKRKLAKLRNISP